MSRINDFSFSFKEPSKAHRVTVCVCVETEGEGKSVCASTGIQRRACSCPEFALENACKSQTFAMAG